MEGESISSIKVEVEPGKQTTRSAVINMLLTGVGVGMLSVPGAVAEAGYILGFLILIATGILGILYVQLLRLCMTPTTQNYEDIGRDAFGRIGLICVTIALNAALIGTGCLLMLLLGSNSVKLFPQLEQKYWILCWGAAMLPLSWLRTMKHVGYVSGTVGVAALVILLVSIVIGGILHAVDEKDVHSYDPAPQSFVGLGITFASMTFGYAVSCTSTTILHDMKHPHERSRAIYISMIILIILYCIIAASGYAGWGHQLLTYDTVIDAMAPTGEKISVVAYLAILSILVVCATHYVVLMNPSFRIVEKALNVTDKPIIWSLLIRTLMVGFTIIIPILIPSFQGLVGLLGSVCFSLIHNFYPVIFWLRLSYLRGRRVDSSPRKIAAIVGLGFILAVSAVGSSFGIYQSIILL
ncbi:Vacuolar amino acid transporter, putative [Perkinsus marinus ATCC 50983]|uniref:Vacuolar amino acid transporter, putative n=1 Tax=Perkinsus marinus (strain ATCC 50983 / TXsc) TaxID=423536 RepID=C5L0B1_PERM5|nr:Vacuolar amino acid transporter, putative [Perkinsus marinus ATCC 50983]EER09969.1 Vacuolar amino acid transporter, putative [Perkinsus marinus ATCC 50983]|eukprot:XP_002778174.1 Vacuolar amino acid transporter, putative [Perkinsus marinus ATCC 50983]